MSRAASCRNCNNPAAVRYRGIAMCSSCALSSAGGEPIGPRRVGRRRRLAPRLLAGVAVAAVAALGVATSAAARPSAPHPTVDFASAIRAAPIPADRSAPDAAEASGKPPKSSGHTPAAANPADGLVAAAKTAAANAHQLADAMQAWAECVATEAAQHRGGPLVPTGTCGPRPLAEEYGLGTAPRTAAPTPPGLAGDAPPGHTGKSDKPDKPDKPDTPANTTPPGQTDKPDTPANTTPPGQTDKPDKP